MRSLIEKLVASENCSYLTRFLIKNCKIQKNGQLLKVVVASDLQDLITKKIKNEFKLLGDEFFIELKILYA